MPVIQQIACIVAVAMPVVVMIVINVLLAIFGERGTLLLPRLGRYSRIELEDEPAPQAAAGEPQASVAQEPLREAA